MVERSVAVTRTTTTTQTTACTCNNRRRPHSTKQCAPVECTYSCRQVCSSYLTTRLTVIRCRHLFGGAGTSTPQMTTCLRVGRTKSAVDTRCFPRPDPTGRCSRSSEYRPMTNCTPRRRAWSGCWHHSIRTAAVPPTVRHDQVLKTL
jgi:hypothetical protein